MRRGRRRKWGVERDKSGRITARARQEDARKPAREARRRHFRVRKGDDLDPALEGITGRLWLVGRLSDAQFNIAQALASAVKGYVEVSDAPKPLPRISSIYPVPSHAGIPPEIATQIEHHTERYLRALAALSPRRRQTLWTVVIEERDIRMTPVDIRLLAGGLTQVIDFLRNSKS